jgi:hypothetical protein
MNYFDLFSSLERDIRAAGPGDDHYATAAASVLRGEPAYVDFDAALVLDWAIHTAALPLQTWENDFGHPSITVVRNDEFRVDVIYWGQNASPRHRHISCGAFAAVAGRRLHIDYAFQAGERLDPCLRAGRLTANGLALMNEGEVRAIEPDLIHALFWIEKPSVTLAVRCHAHPGAPEQRPLEYVPPGIEVLDKVHQPQALVSKRMMGLQMMRMANEALYWAAFDRVLADGAPILAFHAVEDAVVVDPTRVRAALETTRRTDETADVLLNALPSLHRIKLFERLMVPDPTAQLVGALAWADATPRAAAEILSQDAAGGDIARAIQKAHRVLSEKAPASGPYIDALADAGALTT